MLINCSECGKEVSDKAEACPSCGNPTTATSVAGAKVKKTASLSTKIVRTSLAVLVGVVVIGVVASNSGSQSAVAVPVATQASQAPPAPPRPESNAVRSAKQYLSFAGFSRKGLIRQLSSDAGDGYEIADATAAVDSLDVDWNLQAARSAKQYLAMTGFSCKGLVQQLSAQAGDQYTVDQASFGAKSAGAC